MLISTNMVEQLEIATRQIEKLKSYRYEGRQKQDQMTTKIKCIAKHIY